MHVLKRLLRHGFKSTTNQRRFIIFIIYKLKFLGRLAETKALVAVLSLFYMGEGANLVVASSSLR